MVATVNPCGFAMLPAYLSYFLGLEDDDADGAPGRGGPGAAGGAGGVGRVPGRVRRGGHARRADVAARVQNMPWVSVVIGVALVALGVAMLCGFEVNVAGSPGWTGAAGDRTVGSMFVFGVSYAIASIGCTLPLFLGAVAGTISRESVVDGLVVFGLYGLGMTLVLVALTVAIALARTSIVRLLRRAQPYIGRVAGGLVALAGAYVAW